MRERIRRVVAGFVWLVLVVAIALGAAGLVVGADHLPGTSARAELTYARDREVLAVAEAVSGRLAPLADRVAALGVQARGALAALNGTDTDTAEAAIGAGDLVLVEALALSATMRRDLTTAPYVGRADTGLLLSPEVVARHAALASALEATDDLQDAWGRLTIGSVAAIRLSTELAAHDRQVAEAAQLGRAARYDDAIAVLEAAELTIGAARAVRDRLANTVDVTILDQWLDRNAAYDLALRNLYAAYAKVGTRVTDELRAAIAAEASARENLPPDTRGLIVIMAEIGRGGMTGAVIAIEEARGRLTVAIEAAAAAGSPADGAAAP